MKATKQSGKGKIKNMKQMIKQILGPSAENKHLFLDKIHRIANHLEQYDILYQDIMKKFMNQQVDTLFNKDDIEILKNIKEMIERIQQEQPSVPISVLSYMKSKTVTEMDFAQIQKQSDYVNGLVKDSVVQKIIAFLTNSQKQFKEILENNGFLKICQLKIIFNQCQECGSIKIFECETWGKITSALCQEDDQDDTLQRASVIISILCKQAEKLHELMIKPEIDVLKMRDLIEKAIKEFKSQVPGCDLAFQKLLNSLDVFVQKFDTYYEKFLSEGKDPMIFFFDFIEDVKKQYADTDSKNCRVILKQFRGIQKKFGEKLAENINNEGIRDLYEQLCDQMEKAGSVIGMAEE